MLDTFNSEIHTAELVTVPYEFQHRGNEMLKIITKCPELL